MTDVGIFLSPARRRQGFVKGSLYSVNSRQVISTFTGMEFLISMVSNVSGPVLKSVIPFRLALRHKIRYGAV